MRLTAIACAIAISALLVACDDGATLVPPQDGQYSGFYEHEQVTAALKNVSDSELTLTFSSQTWTLNWQDPSNIVLQGPGGSETFQPEDDSSGDASGCFTTKAGDNTIRLCWSPNEIHWAEIGPDGSELAELDLARLLTDELPSLETPQRYSLDDLVARAKKRNFQTVVQFQEMVLAKNEALNADLNLLPHGNPTDAFNILSGSLYTELKSIGDLVPFLLPNRWFRVAAANDMAAAEKDSWAIMDLDGVNYVESFAYASARDEQALAQLGSERAMIAGLRDFVRGEEKAGIEPIGASDDLTSLINKIDLSVSSLQTLQSNELSALAKASGFYNPEAVIGVDFKQDSNAPWAGSPLKADYESAAALAVSRATELRQMEDMLAWAKNEARAKMFDWMDPSGDENGGIGLGLPSYIMAGQDEVAVIQAQSDVVKQDLLHNLQTAVLQLNQAASDYQLAVQGAAIQERRVLRETQDLKVHISFVMSDLLDALQDQVNSQLAQIDAEYGYQVALSRFDRILYQGAYANLGQQQ